MLHETEITQIRRKVLSELSRLAFKHSLAEQVQDILTTVVTDNGSRYRCCVHKERAVLKERINLALSQDMTLPLQEAARRALEQQRANMPVINVIPEACDECPIDKFIVTDACRNCLAHNCIASCPKKAIKVIQNRAYIDKAMCIECGLCKRSCRYGAIIEIGRPCERSCSLGAINSADDRRVSINYDRCVACGNCKLACPFGAIDEQSFIVQVIQQLRSAARVYAILAPSFVGQFGVKIKPGQVVSGLKKIGFYDVQEVAVGADAVAMAEALELSEAVPAEKEFMTTSCCPAFVAMVEKHMPELVGHVSTTPSPMVMLGKKIKAEDPAAVVVFIGPCTAKKMETKKSGGIIDFSLTFEELDAVLNGAGVQLADMPEEGCRTQATYEGNLFACAGGVAKAVIGATAAMGMNTAITTQQCDGLENCKTLLTQVKRGKIKAELVEGMACSGGCVNGPGVLADCRVTAKQVERFAVQGQAGNLAGK